MLSAAEFDFLINLNKFFEKEKLEINLAGSQDQRSRWTECVLDSTLKHKFLLHYNRASLSFRYCKYSFNFNHKNIITLLRFCSDCIHTNPPEKGGETFIGRPHVHIYDEDYGDKIAYPVSSIGIPDNVDTTDINLVFTKFIEYCKIQKPVIRNSLDL